MVLVLLELVSDLLPLSGLGNCSSLSSAFASHGIASTFSISCSVMSVRLTGTWLLCSHLLPVDLLLEVFFNLLLLSCFLSSDLLSFSLLEILYLLDVSFSCGCSCFPALRIFSHSLLPLCFPQMLETSNSGSGRILDLNLHALRSLLLLHLGGCRNLSSAASPTRRPSG